MAKVYFYCDESGAKGYADRDEAFPGEVGVFAGIMVPGECIADVKPLFDVIAEQYASACSKLHIAEIPNEQQDAVRSAVFAAIRDSRLPCFWYAIHVAGLHNDFSSAKTSRLQGDAAMKAARDGAAPRVKHGSPRDDPRSMHVELFVGLYSHLVAFLLERDRCDMEVDVRIDQVDTSLVERFHKLAEELLGAEFTDAMVTGYDTAAGAIVKGHVSSKTLWPREYGLPKPVRSLAIESVSDRDGLVLAADILANSLHHVFTNRSSAGLYGPLNCTSAVEAHPLAQHLDTFRDWGSGDAVGDGLYRHPKSS